MKPPAGLIKVLEDSLRWSRDHKGPKYVHAYACEDCLQLGMAHGVASYTGQTPQQVLNEYKRRIDSEKKKTVKRPVQKKRVVVRRVKK